MSAILRLNISKFLELQGTRNETQMADFMGVSRTQLWRIKTGECSVGGEFLVKFKNKFPHENLDDYFYPASAPQKQQAN